MEYRKRTKYVHEGRYVAEVEVTLIEDDTSWTPYFSVQDAYRLDDVKEALKSGDLKSAAHHGRVFEMRPIA